ncbi:alpha-1,2-fucosyltransferase [Nostoc sp. CHAB 5834]|nr:alpha-1,2-fucosyltransferase [Nostoc sp. CHAB 5834]
MIYIIKPTGQLGNQLFRLGHHIANSIQYEYQINYNGFTYKHLFPELDKNKLLSVSSTNSKLQAIIIKLIAKVIEEKSVQALLNKVGIRVLSEPLNFTEHNYQFIEKAQHGCIIATNWLFRDNSSFIKLAPRIRELFALAPEYRYKAENRINSIRTSHDDILIGVHFRRGDYREWKGGQYYFEVKVFTNIMKRILTLFPEKRVKFIIFSNENYDESLFEGFMTFNSAYPYEIDLATMAMCDRLIGPPSTFSGWASFWGEVPLFVIRKESALPSLNDFQIFGN